jgi:hypothetical protein
LGNVTVKKRRKKTRKKIAGKTQQVSATPEAQIPAKSKTPIHRRLPRALNWTLGGAPIAVLGFVLAVWGPPWPVPPSFSPGPPSSGSAFDIPFQVENKSALFGFNNLKITCIVDSAFAKSHEGPGSVTFGPDLGFAVQGSNQLERLSSGPYICPVRRTIRMGTEDAADMALQRAQIRFESEYDSRLLWGRSRAEDGPFTLITTTIPPHWERGVPLK